MLFYDQLSKSLCARTTKILNKKGTSLFSTSTVDSMWRKCLHLSDTRLYCLEEEFKISKFCAILLSMSGILILNLENLRVGKKSILCAFVNNFCISFYSWGGDILKLTLFLKLFWRFFFLGGGGGVIWFSNYKAL